MFFTGLLIGLFVGIILTFIVAGFVVSGWLSDVFGQAFGY